MMQYINGQDRILYIDIEGNGDYLPIACLTSNSFRESATFVDTTTRDNPNGWETSRPVEQSYTISFSGLETASDIIDNSSTYFNLKLIKRGRQLINWKILDNLGKEEYGQAYISNLSDSASIDDYIEFSGELTGYGQVMNLIEVTYENYSERVTSDGGTLNKNCTIKYINNLMAL